MSAWMASGLSPWAWVLGDAYAGDSELGEAIRATPAAPLCMADGAWKATASFYGACPLCSRGEHGSEHLAIWRPAVAAAWLRVGASHAPNPVRALSGDRDAAACVARLLHQASFIASSIHKSAVEWREGADWLVRAVCTPVSSEDWRDCGDDAGGPAHGGDPAYAYVWEETGGCGCWECEDRAGADRPTSARPGAPKRDGTSDGSRASRRCGDGGGRRGAGRGHLAQPGRACHADCSGGALVAAPGSCTRGRLTSGGRFTPAGDAGRRGRLSSPLGRSSKATSSAPRPAILGRFTSPMRRPFILPWTAVPKGGRQAQARWCGPGGNSGNRGGSPRLPSASVAKRRPPVRRRGGCPPPLVFCWPTEDREGGCTSAVVASWS